jgi:phenylpyruvate tautomerase PptA (4-oxalocrotonate tautomerase family)
MPLLKLETTVTVPDEKRKNLITALSKIVAETIGKPELYVMVTIGPCDILMSGKPGEAAFVDVRSIGGLTDEVNKQLSKKVCALLKEALGVPENRTYLNFMDVDAVNWGWKGSTFG